MATVFDQPDRSDLRAWVEFGESGGGSTIGAFLISNFLFGTLNRWEILLDEARCGAEKYKYMANLSINSLSLAALIYYYVICEPRTHIF